MCIAHTSTPLAADGPSTAQEPIWLTDIPATVELLAAAEVAVIGFFQVCDTPHLYTPQSGTLGLKEVKPGACWASDVDAEVRGHTLGFQIIIQAPLLQSSLPSLCMRSLSCLLQGSLSLVAESIALPADTLKESGCQQEVSQISSSLSQTPSVCTHRTLFIGRSESKGTFKFYSCIYYTR